MLNPAYLKNGLKTLRFTIKSKYMMNNVGSRFNKNQAEVENFSNFINNTRGPWQIQEPKIEAATHAEKACFNSSAVQFGPRFAMKRVEHGPPSPPPLPCCSCNQFENIIIHKCLMRQ
jgi:hypothetical protein